jgi:hypothetical protein
MKTHVQTTEFEEIPAGSPRPDAACWLAAVRWICCTVLAMSLVAGFVALASRAPEVAKLVVWCVFGAPVVIIMTLKA